MPHIPITKTGVCCARDMLLSQLFCVRTPVPFLSSNRYVGIHFGVRPRCIRLPPAHPQGCNCFVRDVVCASSDAGIFQVGLGKLVLYQVHTAVLGSYVYSTSDASRPPLFAGGADRDCSSGGHYRYYYGIRTTGADPAPAAPFPGSAADHPPFDALVEQASYC